MTNFKQLKNADYRTLNRNEAVCINGGRNSCSEIRANCASRCGNDYSFCFYSCVDAAGCPV
ncbi:hypothetical protein [Aquimarina algicola]|uniref:Uncharacterized protein n=1 Tax=Aquimarina algicola TaxID=2589995 RepID=A0A504J134_9FLAO|nr:hypothetical protein [Aquimarina algicola]TPN81698.1 hypothetical protein FHK87_24170 [Aquimarina algicola]